MCDCFALQEKVQINWFNKWLQSAEFANPNFSVELMVSLLKPLNPNQVLFIYLFFFFFFKKLIK